MKTFLMSMHLFAFIVPAFGVDQAPSDGIIAVAKPVKIVRREIIVTIVGEERPVMPRDRRPTVEGCFSYWKKSMDRELPNRPDLMVLPEGVDSWNGMTPTEKIEWCRRRGDGLFAMFAAYAKEHRLYIVFNSARLRPDGDLCNTTYMVDRDGDCVAVYDKYYPAPTEIWKDGATIRPGDEAVTAETDFGRVAFMTCFDLNFRDYIEKVRQKKPDVICFCSAYDGSDFWRKAVGYTCRAYLVSATTGFFAKAITGPCGEDIAHQHNYGYFRTFSQKINTNFRVVHMGMHWKHLTEAVRRYGQEVTVRNPGNVGACTLLSNNPERPIDSIIDELGIETWDRYYERSVRTRLDALASAAPGAVVFENDVARLILGTNGVARSIKLKATGEELLKMPSITPFATITHARPYDKIAQLTYPAQMRDFKANRMERKGDMLEIGFAGTRDILRVSVSVLPDRFEFTFRGFDIAGSEMDPKWTWKPESVRFAQFTVAGRAHFGEWMNVAWDDSSAVALMGLNAETRIASERQGNDRTLFAGGEIAVGYDGIAAALIPSATTNLLNAVDKLERDHGLPLGVEARRSKWANASYFWAKDIEPGNADKLIAAANRGGFPLFMISYTSFAKTCGHFVWRGSYPGEMADLRSICDKVRAAGMLPGLHMHYSKISRDDPYVASEHPDTRFNVVSAFALASDIGTDDAEIPLQSRPVNWNDEDGRRLVQIGREWIEFTGISKNAPWRLVGCRRGFLGSKATAHTANDIVRHVDVDNWVRFIRCDAGSAIIDEIADRLAVIYKECGFRFAYFDGAEDVAQPYWYNVTKAQKRVWDKLDPSPIAAETYVRNHFGWHMFGRGNAFDPFAPGKLTAAYHRYQEPCMREARENFTTVDLGWTDLGGKMVDEFRFLLSCADEWNAPVALWVGIEELEANPNGGKILDLFSTFNKMKGRKNENTMP